MSAVPVSDPYDSPCPGCGHALGDHTVRGYRDCLQTAGFDYHLPFEDVPGAPVHFPGVDGEMVGEITVGGGFVDSALGRVPVLRFIFTGAGPEPMSRRSLKPIHLVMDPNGLRSVRQMVSSAVDRAILAARRGH